MGGARVAVNTPLALPQHALVRAHNIGLHTGTHTRSTARASSSAARARVATSVSSALSASAALAETSTASSAALSTPSSPLPSPRGAHAAPPPAASSSSISCGASAAATTSTSRQPLLCQRAARHGSCVARGVGRGCEGGRVRRLTTHTPARHSVMARASVPAACCSLVLAGRSRRQFPVHESGSLPRFFFRCPAESSLSPAGVSHDREKSCSEGEEEQASEQELFAPWPPSFGSLRLAALSHNAAWAQHASTGVTTVTATRRATQHRVVEQPHFEHSEVRTASAMSDVQRHSSCPYAALGSVGHVRLLQPRSCEAQPCCFAAQPCTSRAGVWTRTLGSPDPRRRRSRRRGGRPWACLAMPVCPAACCLNLPGSLLDRWWCPRLFPEPQRTRCRTSSS